MAMIGIALGAQQTPPILGQPDFGPGPQASATPAQDPTHQDVVTLAGKTAESAQTRSGNNNAQFGEAAAFFFAESQSFRAANGSGGSQTAHVPSVPELPVKLTTDGPVRQSAMRGSVDPAQNPEAPTPVAPEHGGADSVAADLEANNGISAASQPATGASHTPLAELAQLDRTLQQIGIDPQSISLFNRMAMLLYANDPAALKILVQTLQSGAQQLGGDASADKAIPSQPQPEAGSTVQNVFSPQAQTPNGPPVNQDTNGSQVEASAPAQLALQAQGVFSAKPPQDQSTAVPANTESTRTIASNPGIRVPYQPINLAPQLGALNLTFAAVGVPQLISGPQNTQPGQLLNVTF